MRRPRRSAAPPGWWRSPCAQVLLALELLLGERELRLPVRELGAEVEELRPVGVDARQIDGRVDLGQQVALFDRLADLDVELAQLAGDLGADVDIVARLQVAQRRRAVLDIAKLDRGGGLGVLRGVAGGPQHPAAAASPGHQEQRKERKGPAAPRRTPLCRGPDLGARLKSRVHKGLGTARVVYLSFKIR